MYLNTHTCTFRDTWQEHMYGILNRESEKKPIDTPTLKKKKDVLILLMSCSSSVQINFYIIKN